MSDDIDAEMNDVPEARFAAASAHAANMSVVGLALALMQSKAIDAKTAALGIMLISSVVSDDVEGRIAKMIMKRNAKLIADLDGEGVWLSMLATTLETLMTPREMLSALEAWRAQATSEERSADILQLLGELGFLERPADPSRGAKATPKKVSPRKAKAGKAKPRPKKG